MKELITIPEATSHSLSETTWLTSFPSGDLKWDFADGSHQFYLESFREVQGLAIPPPLATPPTHLIKARF
jgi:hypothetical protein